VDSVPISGFREKYDIKIYLKANYQFGIYTLWENLSTDKLNATNSVRLQEKGIENKRAGLGCFVEKKSCLGL
jgi:hypothetical protein